MRCPFNEPLQRNRCYEKGRNLRHPQIKKRKKKETEKESKKESRKNGFVELTVSYCAGVKSKDRYFGKMQSSPVHTRPSFAILIFIHCFIIFSFL